MQTEQERYLSVCPHSPFKCLNNFKCPWFIENECHVADDHGISTSERPSVLYFNRGPWSIEHQIMKGER